MQIGSMDVPGWSAPADAEFLSICNPPPRAEAVGSRALPTAPPRAEVGWLVVLDRGVSLFANGAIGKRLAARYASADR